MKLPMTREREAEIRAHASDPNSRGLAKLGDLIEVLELVDDLREELEAEKRAHEAHHRKERGR